MKKCLTLFALLVQLQLFSQVTYQHYLNYSVKWTRTFSAPYHFETHNYYITGDTVFGGQFYYKVYDHYHTSDTYSGTLQQSNGTAYSMALREDSFRRFWVRNSYDTAEHVRYDFNVLPTDSLLGSAIIQKDTIYFNGEPRQRFGNETNNVLIEGIGIPDTRTSFSSLEDIMHCFFKDTAVYSYDGNCFILSSVEETEQVNFKLYPNPVTGTLFIEATENILYVSVIDFSGRTVLAQFPDAANLPVNISNIEPGIYLIQLNSRNRQHIQKLVVE